MTKEELEMKEALKLLNVAKEWLRTAHWEGNVQSLAKLILSFTEPKDKRIAELEKENAELKESDNCLTDKVVDLKCKVSEANSNAVIWTEELVAENKYLIKQLTKAKEIIKDYMIIVKGGNITVCSVPDENRCINVLKFNEEAGQFLKNMEVEK